MREINRVKDRQLVLPGTQKEALLLALSFLYPVPFLLLGFRLNLKIFFKIFKLQHSFLVFLTELS